ncbi:MAG: hypothetical protein ACI4TC_00855 [Kiritimatiellia bacterium]
MTFCLTGCFSLERGAIRTTGQEHVHVSNYGWYLFHCIPLACGNASTGAWTPWVIFRNDVTMDKVQGRFMSYANGQGCDVSDLGYVTNESVMLNIPGINAPLPIPYLLTYREIQLSGVLTPRSAAIHEPADAHEAACAAEVAR